MYKDIAPEDFLRMEQEAQMDMNYDVKDPLIEFLRPMVLHNALHIENKLRDHDEQKGDSWKDCDINYLKAKLKEELAEWSSRNEPRELLDLMAVAMMLFCRLTGNWGKANFKKIEEE